jgi:hypothetical protein
MKVGYFTLREYQIPRACRQIWLGNIMWRIWPLLGNGSVSTFPLKRINTEKRNNRNNSELDGVNWINLAQDTEQWLALVNLRVPWNARDSSTSWVTTTVSIRTLLHGVSQCRKEPWDGGTCVHTQHPQYHNSLLRFHYPHHSCYITHEQCRFLATMNQAH